MIDKKRKKCGSSDGRDHGGGGSLSTWLSSLHSDGGDALSGDIQRELEKEEEDQVEELMEKKGE